MTTRRSATGSVPKITPARMFITLAECYDSMIPPMFWGPPGVGKSDCVRKFAQDRGIGCIDIRLSQYDPVDLRGVPKVETQVQRIQALHTALEIAKKSQSEDRQKAIAQELEEAMDALIDRGNNVVTHWAAPAFLPIPERDGEKGILFLDEITSADGQVQAAAYQLVLDRRLGEYALPDGWLVVAAGNRPEDRAVVKDMSSALANRFCHFEVEHKLDDWIEWAFEANIDPRVISYHRHDNGISLYNFDPTSNDKAFPTPRTWERVSDALKNKEGIIPTDTIHGCVGIGEGVKFEAFCDIAMHIPDPNKMLERAMEGKKIDLPDLSREISITKKKRFRNDKGVIEVKDIDYKFNGACLLHFLLTSISAKTSPETAEGIWNIIEQLSSESYHKDFSISFMMDCMRVNKVAVVTFENKARLKSWSKDNRDLVGSLDQRFKEVR